MHWLGAQFVSVNSRMPVISLLTCSNFVRTTEEKERTKEDQREHPCCGIRTQFTKHTVLHRNEGVRVREIYTGLL